MVKVLKGQAEGFDLFCIKSIIAFRVLPYKKN